MGLFSFMKSSKKKEQEEKERIEREQLRKEMDTMVKERLGYSATELSDKFSRDVHTRVSYNKVSDSLNSYSSMMSTIALQTARELEDENYKKGFDAWIAQVINEIYSKHPEINFEKIYMDVHEFVSLFSGYYGEKYDYNSGIINSDTEMLVLFCSLAEGEEKRDKIRARFNSYNNQSYGSSSSKTSRR